MKKLVLGSVLVTLVIGLIMGGFNLYVESKNPVGKCFKLKDDGGLAFVGALTFKVDRVFQNKTYGAALVDFQQPEDMEQLMFILQATTSMVNLQDPSALKRVDCPKEPKN